MDHRQLTIASFSKLNISLLTPKEKIMLTFAIITTLSCGITLPIFVYCFAIATSLFEDADIKQEVILYEMGLDTIYLGIVAGVTGIIMMILWYYIGVKVDQRIRRIYLNCLLHIGHVHINIEPFKVKNDCIEIEKGLGKKVGFFLFGLTIYVASEIIILVVNWKLGLVNLYALFTLIVIGIIWFCSNQPTISTKKDKFECSALYAEHTLKNIYSVISLANFAHEYNKYESRLRISRLKGIHYGKIYSLNLLVFLFLILNSFSLTVWYAGKLVLENRQEKEDNPIELLNYSNHVKQGNILVIIVGLLFLHVSIGSLTNNAKDILISCVNGCRFFKYKTALDVYNKQEEMRDSSSLADLNVDNAVEISNFSSFNLNLIIPNKMKTYIIIEEDNEEDIANELIEAIEMFSQEKAKVVLYGNEIRKYKAASVRKLIAYVNGSCSLFNSSIYENITIVTHDNIDSLKYQQALSIAKANDIIGDYGEEFNVGPRGEYLSRYRRFKVSIARCIMTKAKIYLIDYKGFEYRDEVYEIDTRLTKYTKDNHITYVAINLKPRDALYCNSINIVKDKVILTQREVNGLDLNQSISLDQSDLNADSTKSNDKELILHDSYKRKGTVSTALHHNPTSSDEDILIQIDKVVKHFPSLSELGSRTVNKSEVITKYPRHIALVVILIFINGTISPLNGRIISYALLALSERSSETLKNLTELYALIFLAFAAISSIAQALESYLYNYLGESIKTNMRLLQYEKYLNINYNYFKDMTHPNYKLISKLNFQSKNIAGVAIYFFFTSWQKGISFMVGFIMSMNSDWVICLLQCCLVPLIFLFLYFNWRVNRINKPIGVKYEMDFGGIVEECYFNRKLINALGVQEVILKRFSLLKRFINPPRYWSNRVYSFSFGFSLFAMLVPDGIMLVASSYLIHSHVLKFEEIIKSSYTMLISIFGLVMVQGYISSLAISWNVTQGQMVIINEPIPPQGISEFVKMKDVPIQGDLEFTKVFFAYSKQSPVLFNDFNMTFKTGKCYAIHGKGKTTLFNLLLRIYTVDQGNINIGGVDIQKINICDLRHSVAFFHEEFNFDYIRRNYCFQNVTGEALKDDELAMLMMKSACFIIIDDERIIDKIIKGRIEFDKIVKCEDKMIIVTTMK